MQNALFYRMLNSKITKLLILVVATTRVRPPAFLFCALSMFVWLRPPSWTKGHSSAVSRLLFLGTLHPEGAARSSLRQPSLYGKSAPRKLWLLPVIRRTGQSSVGSPLLAVPACHAVRVVRVIFTSVAVISLACPNLHPAFEG